MPIYYFSNYLGKHNFAAHIAEKPSARLSISVVIPCFNEPDILLSLASLWNCDRIGLTVEVIIVANYPEGSDESTVFFHRQTLLKIREWIQYHNDKNLRFYIIDAPALPKKFAGVGLARKIGMDEAVARFSEIGNEKGIICGFDADALVDPNYLTAIEECFRKDSGTTGVAIYFEHPLNLDNERFLSGITQYELHLRYLVQAIRYTGFPYAFHTVGSSFAVSASAYVKQGGMNRFKAGEDFYFLNKIIQLGNFSELNTTRVIPAPRVSNRVPFGTGASMTRWMSSEEKDFLTYQFCSFLPLRSLFSALETIYQIKSLPVDIGSDKCLGAYLEINDFSGNLVQFFENSSSFSTFKKRFFAWFDAFRIVKYLNYAAENQFPKQPVVRESKLLLNAIEFGKETGNHRHMLDIYRSWDRKGTPGD